MSACNVCKAPAPDSWLRSGCDDTGLDSYSLVSGNQRGAYVLHVTQTPYHALNWGPVAWLGKISYSLYLWQELFCSNPNLHHGYILALPAIGCACLSYYIVEQPMLRWRESLNNRT